MNLRDVARARRSVAIYRRLTAGALVRLWRSRSERSQVDVALAAKMPGPRLSRIEGGGAVTTPEEVRRVARVIGDSDAPPDEVALAVRLVSFGGVE